MAQSAGHRVKVEWQGAPPVSGAVLEPLKGSQQAEQPADRLLDGPPLEVFIADAAGAPVPAAPGYWPGPGAVTATPQAALGDGVAALPAQPAAPVLAAALAATEPVVFHTPMGVMEVQALVGVGVGCLFIGYERHAAAKFIPADGELEVSIPGRNVNRRPVIALGLSGPFLGYELLCLPDRPPK